MSVTYGRRCQEFPECRHHPRYPNCTDGKGICKHVKATPLKYVLFFLRRLVVVWRGMKGG